MINWPKVIIDYHKTGKALCPKCGAKLDIEVYTDTDKDSPYVFNGKKCTVFKCNRCDIAQLISGGEAEK